VQATAQGERRKLWASGFGFAFLSFVLERVTCIVKVSLLYFLVTCKVQVTGDRELIMENTVLSQAHQSEVPAVSGIGTFVGVSFLAWFVLIFILGAQGAFVAQQGAPPLALLIGLSAPLILFLLGYWTIRPLREFVLSADLRLIVGIQAWRWAGFGFLALYAHGVLPGIFAWPAGLGDMAVGVTAPLVLSGLLRRPGFAAGPCRRREYRGARAAARSQFLWSCFDISYGATAAGADSGVPGAHVSDPAPDGAVSGAKARQIGNLLNTGECADENPSLAGIRH
jgi:hypothetical protein